LERVFIVNTQDPKETIEFIKRHFDHPNKGRNTTIHRANYHKEGV